MGMGHLLLPSKLCPIELRSVVGLRSPNRTSRCLALPFEAVSERLVLQRSYSISLYSVNWGRGSFAIAPARIGRIRTRTKAPTPIQEVRSLDENTMRFTIKLRSDDPDMFTERRARSLSERRASV